MFWTEVRKKRFILENTRVVEPLLCPEIKLRLITPECPLWKASEQDVAAIPVASPYWGFCWAGGQGLARYILDRVESVAGKRVFVFGAGCGIEAIAAAMADADFVLACDIDPVAIEAVKLNAILNNVSLEVTSENYLGAQLIGFDVLLAGDMFYDRGFAEESMAWLRLLAKRGVSIFLGDPLRGNLSGDSLVRVATYRAPADVDLDGKYLQETAIYSVCWNHSSELYAEIQRFSRRTIDFLPVRSRHKQSHLHLL